MCMLARSRTCHIQAMKRSDIKRRPLSDTVLSSLEPEAKEYREKYGVDRIYLVVSPNGRKRWEMRHKKPDGKWSWLGLGGYPDVSAKRAREKALEILGMVSDGVDPLERKSRRVDLFRDVAEEWYQRKADQGRAELTLRKMRMYLDKDILPAIGSKPIASISRADCKALQQSVEARGAEVAAKKIRGWLNEIFDYAIAHDLIEDNPAINLRAIAKVAPKEKQFPHLLEEELPDFLRAMRNAPARIKVRTAVWMLLLTASRPHMVRSARWNDIDLDEATWRIPADVMKMDREHVTPLPRQVVAMLREVREVTGRSQWVFPGDGAKSAYLSHIAINRTVHAIGYKGRMTGHGSRHTASTLLREHGWPRDYVETQLAHKEKGVAGVYNKAMYLPQRAVMMQWYADYLGALEAGMTPEMREALDARVVRF